MEDKQERIAYYAIHIYEAIANLFDEDNENYLRIEDDEVTEFIHALATVAPTKFFNRMTGNNEDWLGFNHLSNRLIHQFSVKREDLNSDN